MTIDELIKELETIKYKRGGHTEVVIHYAQNIVSVIFDAHSKVVVLEPPSALGHENERL